MAEDEMVGWYHKLNGHELERAPGDSECKAEGGPVLLVPWIFQNLRLKGGGGRRNFLRNGGKKEF